MSDLPAPLRWPAGIAPRAVALPKRGGATVGPATLTSLQSSLESDAGFWEIALDDMPVGGPARVQDYRAFLSRLGNGARPALVPVWDWAQAPWVAAGGRDGNLTEGRTFDGGYAHTDGYRFYDPPILVTLSAAAALRATSVSVTVTTAGTIRAGMVFSLYGERLHVIEEKLTATSWTIWPPLRRDYPAGARCEFANPTVKAAMASPNTGDLSLTRGTHGYPGIVFREAP